MQIDTALTIGVMFGCALYLLLSTRFVRILFGLGMLSNAANLLVLSMSGSPDDHAAPIVNAASLETLMVDPVPQALILTAIVIGFAVMAYVILLLYRIFLDHRVSDLVPLFSEETTQKP